MNSAPVIDRAREEARNTTAAAGEHRRGCDHRVGLKADRIFEFKIVSRYAREELQEHPRAAVGARRGVLIKE
jgi:hypothetical protein